ncbi:MAG: methyltransferase domain-containing protein [Candidatus Taylorbacteria bacterium]|nr:methyltransferase domain-containing protein [Candidatus Taylorbacteria bacterium]
MHTRDELFEHLLHESQVLQNDLIRRAFSEIDRADFVTEDYKVEAYEDYALPTIKGQTISQPTTVAFMLELLDPKEGHQILDLGTGSAWTTALLSNIVGPKGKVEGLEIVPELVELGQANLKKSGCKNAEISQAKQGIIGKPGRKFDRILVSASGEELPNDLLKQLKDGGIMVVPVKESIWRIVKSGESYESKEYPGFIFVPLR